MELVITHTYLWQRATFTTAYASQTGLSIHAARRIPVQPSLLLTLTHFFLRPLMLWKPVNWLLSNCLSFRLRSYLGPSVQTHHPVGGATMNRSKQHICSQVEETRHLSRNVRDTSVRAEALDTLPVLVLSQSNPEVLNLFFCFFCKCL